MISIDMDLPKSCSECRFLYQSRCMAINHNHVIMVYVGDISKRAEECPLKPFEAPVTASIDLDGEITAEKEKPLKTGNKGYHQAIANALFREWIKWFEGGTE